MTTLHPQNAVPAWVVDDITTLIREEQLDGPDLHDIAVSVDDGEDDWSDDAGLLVWSFLRAVTDQFDVSAGFLVSEACVCLGWPVTA